MPKKRLNKFSAIAALLLISGVDAADPSLAQPPDAYSFRGFHLGGTETELRAALPYFTCRPSDKPQQSDIRCTADGGPSVMDYGNQRASTIAAEGFGERIGQMFLMFDTCKSLALENVMSARFGQPMGPPGARAWRGKDVTVTLIARSGSCVVGYTEDTYQAERKARQQNAAKAPASGM